jgi:hypothetical protein
LVSFGSLPGDKSGISAFKPFKKSSLLNGGSSVGVVGSDGGARGGEYSNGLLPGYG